MFLLRNLGFFGKKHIIPEQVAAEKNEQKIRRNPRKSWLRCISISRTRDILDLLSLGSNIQKILSRIQA